MQMEPEKYFQDRTFTEKDKEELLAISGAEFEACRFESLNLMEVNLKGMKFIDCTFSKCNLSNSNFKVTVIRGTKFLECKLIGINWCECQTMVNSDFNDSQLDYGVFQGLNLSKMNFSNSSMRDADFSQANLTKSSFVDTKLKNAIFTNANLTEADFRGATEYFIDLRFTKVRKAKFSLPEAMSLLHSLEIVLE